MENFQSHLHNHIFHNRKSAGQQLASILKKYLGENLTLVALPRGGVVVGYEIAKELHLPLYICNVRKIGHPQNRELGIGAVAETGLIYLDREMLALTGLSMQDLTSVIETEKNELKRRQFMYREGKLPQNLDSKIIILVDDGIATGVTMLTAIFAVKKQKIKKIILAVPVCAKDSAVKIQKNVDEFICLNTVENFGALGNFYEEFEQVNDEEVISLLRKSRYNTAKP